MQLTRGMLGRLGHHCRTKCALSGYQGGKGNGLAFEVGVVVVVVAAGVSWLLVVVGNSSLVLSCMAGKMNFFVRVREGGTSCAMIGIESFVASFVVYVRKSDSG